MKLFFAGFIFIIIATGAYPQNKSSLITKTASSANRWNLEEYVWSHTHPNPGKNDKQVLNFEAIDDWISLPLFEGVTISRNGQYFVYRIQNNLKRRVDSVVVQSTINAWRFVLGKEAWSGFFSADDKQFIFQDKQGLCFLKLGTSECRYEKEVETYKIEGKKEWLAYRLNNGDSTLVLLNLVNGKEFRFNDVSTYDFSFSGLNQSSEWLVCKLKNNNLLLHHLVSQREEEFENIAAYSFDPSKKWFVCKVNGPSDELILYNLGNGDKSRFSSVRSWKISKGGDWLLLNKGMQLDYVNFKSGNINSIWISTDTNTVISSFGFDGTGKQVVFVARKGTEKTIWYWSNGMEKAEMKISAQYPGMGSNISIQDGAKFTDNDQCIRFTWQHVIENVKYSADAIGVDVWSYQDKTLRCIRPDVKERNVFNALLNISTGKVIYIENAYEKLEMINRDYALITKSGHDVYGDRYWEKGYRDSAWLINLFNGNRKFLASKKSLYEYLWFSPDGQYVIYFDADKQCSYFSMDLATGKVVNITAGVPAWQLGVKLSSYRTSEKPTWSDGIKLWVGEGKQFLVYDNYDDIWQLDPGGQKPAVCITNGLGRLKNISFGLLSPVGGRMETGINDGSIIGKDTLLLTAYNRKTKWKGFYRKVLGMKIDPELLSMEPCYMEWLRDGTSGIYPIKAEGANTWIVNRETATEAPSFFVTHDFKTFKQLTFLQPQKKYNWLTAELHNFKRLDGTTSQGVFYKPENFDPSKKYPVIINFYAEVSGLLYKYPAAEYIDAPHIYENPAWMVSHGYLVFIPDMLFYQGQWGPSTVNTIEGAVQYLRQFSYVDSSHMGAAGHSNSGRFGYYLLTHSHSFAAMSIGAGTTNVISFALTKELEQFEMNALGSGLGNLWKNKRAWLDQSSVLSADKVVSPLLQFHCRKDGVPFEQAVQMFTALRRLDKKVWWLQYDRGGHILSGDDARDFTIRFTQFFDHYLKGAPPPRWMSQVVPSSLKGIESRFELDFKGTCGPHCPICKARNWMIKEK
jgi:hypothetical protein